MRTLEITAERAAQGLHERQEEGLVKPVLLPAPQPEAADVSGDGDGAAPAARPATGPSKLDLIRKVQAYGIEEGGRGSIPPARKLTEREASGGDLES